MSPVDNFWIVIWFYIWEESEGKIMTEQACRDMGFFSYPWDRQSTFGEWVAARAMEPGGWKPEEHREEIQLQRKLDPKSFERKP